MLLGPQRSTLQSEDDNSDGKTEEVLLGTTGVLISYAAALAGIIIAQHSINAHLYLTALTFFA